MVVIRGPRSDQNLAHLILDRRHRPRLGYWVNTGKIAKNGPVRPPVFGITPCSGEGLSHVSPMSGREDQSARQGKVA